jgi:hypothetical protein
LIKYLINFGSVIKGGGNIISLYSVLYKYWKYCKQNDEICEITINQLRKIFTKRHNEEDVQSFKLMLSLFSFNKLINI